MSETEIRRILSEVIGDIDAGRVILPRPRGLRLGALLAGPALAAGLALAGCERAVEAYGVPPVDSEVTDAAFDGGFDALYAAPWDARVDTGVLDGGAMTEYAGPPVDDGAAPEYAVITDGGTPDAEVDSGSEPLYWAPPPGA